jgi:pyridoxine/pyridoxamine 5'-phosphate oxidase
MTDLDKIEKAQQFLNEHKLAVIATVDGSFVPQASVIGYKAIEDMNLIFGTVSSTRKAKSIATNPRVALAIGWDKGKTLQYDGEAQEITDPAEIEKCKREYLSDVPTTAKYVNLWDGKFYRIKPKWIRLSDVSRDPWDTFEIRF